jgi:hypothetical protein
MSCAARDLSAAAQADTRRQVSEWGADEEDDEDDEEVLMLLLLVTVRAHAQTHRVSNTLSPAPPLSCVPSSNAGIGSVRAGFDPDSAGIDICTGSPFSNSSARCW